MAVVPGVPGDNRESRVEFCILKMHSLHSYMLNLNCAGVPVAWTRKPPN
jgi:hypothetical protein